MNMRKCSILYCNWTSDVLCTMVLFERFCTFTIRLCETFNNKVSVFVRTVFDFANSKLSSLRVHIERRIGGFIVRGIIGKVFLQRFVFNKIYNTKRAYIIPAKPYVFKRFSPDYRKKKKRFYLLERITCSARIDSIPTHAWYILNGREGYRIDGKNTSILLGRWRGV